MTTTTGINKGRALLRKSERAIWDREVTAWYLEMTDNELSAAVEGFVLPHFYNELGEVAFVKEEIIAWYGSRELCSVGEETMLSDNIVS